jgi:hypothetical protein
VKRIATLVITLALMAPATALAQGSSTCQAYNPQTCNALTQSTSSGSLPFTGLDMVLLVIGGGTLLATGMVLRRLTRRVGVTGASRVED